MDATPATPRRSRRIVIPAVAAVAVAALAAAGTAVHLATCEDSGVVACRRINEFSQELADGGRPTVTVDEARKLTDQLAASGHESIARIGEVFQLSYHEKNADDRPVEGMYGAVFLTGAFRACDAAGVPMTYPMPRR